MGADVLRTVNLHLILGGPGAGKDSNTKFVVDQLNQRRPNSATLFSLGEALRELNDPINTDPEIRAIKEYIGDDLSLMKSGENLPNLKVRPLVYRTMGRLIQEGYHNIFSTSYPKNPTQLEHLDEIALKFALQGTSICISQVYLHAGVDLLFQRMVETRPHEALAMGEEVRVDDGNPELARQRLNEYYAGGYPMIQREVVAGRCFVFDATLPKGVLQSQMYSLFINSPRS